MDAKKFGELRELADRIRITAIEMAYVAGNKGAHLGGSLSSVEIFAVLYGSVLKIDPMNPLWEKRDRMIVGKEHGRLSEYPALYESGFISKDILMNYMVDGNILAGHPLIREFGMEYSSCSLGMALPVSVGIALNGKRKGKDYRVFTLMGDGELDEGSMWEAFMSAAHYKLDNLIAIVDRNHLSSDGYTEKVMALGDLKGKIQKFGWDCVEIEDGHDIGQLVDAFSYSPSGRPYAIIANTIKGKGISFAENNPNWHHNIMTCDLYAQALKELGV